MNRPEVQGMVAPQFAEVRTAFEQGFVDGRDVGAAVAVTVDGELVVDLWAGHRDRRRTLEWLPNTLSCVFSVSKAVTAICVLQAVAEGLIQLDKPVAVYWPEFAKNGKEAITVRQLMSHQAGLVGFHESVPRDIYYDWHAVTGLLAEEKPWWLPGTRHGYHARTFGFLLGELLHRATGQRLADWLNERLTGPMNLDFHLGLSDPDLQRCAEMIPARVRPGEEKRWPKAMQEMMRSFNDIATPTGAAFQNPSLGPGYMNSAKFRQAEMPALNGHGTARSLARLLGLLPQILPAELLAEATRTHAVGSDEVLKSVTRFGLGLMLHHPESPIGSAERCFGHAGAGGSVAFYDPANRMGFCFAMNQMEEGVITGGTSATAVALAAHAATT